MELRNYQIDLINNLRNEMRCGKRSICAILGCGGGKSVIAANIAKMSTDKGNNVLFIVHRKELCSQIIDTFIKCGVDMWLCKVEMVQTAVRRLNQYPEPALIITDEAHHCIAPSYKKIYNCFPDAYKIGFTATPMRMGGNGLGEVFDSLVESVSVKWLIENGFLAPYKYYSVKLVDTSGLHKQSGDYKTDETELLMSGKTIYGDTIKNYIALANGKKTIVYCSGIKNSKATCEEFQNNGILAAHLDGTTNKYERENTIKAFRDGNIQVLCNVDLFGEGFDVPDCECVILLRPTASLTLHIQQSMRSMRFKENKEAVIIDHVGNVFLHGLPDDEREWSLESSKKKSSENKIPAPKDCPECYACVSLNIKICPYCGYDFKVKVEDENDNIQKVDVILQEIVSADILKQVSYIEYKKCKTYEELERFRKAKGYKAAWTVYKCIELGITLPVRLNAYAEKLMSLSG